MKHCPILLALALAPSLAGAAAAPAPTTQPAAWEVPGRPLPPSYRVLLIRSIFSRTGESAGAQSAAFRLEGAAAAASAPGDASMTLRGVVREGGVCIAIVEDPVSHRVQEVREGGALAGGRVTGITLRGFQYESGGTLTAVAIGHDLRGALAAPITPPRQAVAGAPPATGPAPDPNAPAPTLAAEPAPEQNVVSVDSGALGNGTRRRVRVRVAE